jgi:hypothetical protein
VAADKHGNVNPRVVDVYEDPKNYRASLGKGRDLAVVGRMSKVPKTPAGIRESLKPFHAPAPGTSMRDTIKDLNMPRRMEGTGNTSIAGINPTININGTPVGKEGAVSREVVKAMRFSTKEVLAMFKAAKAHEDRLTFA